MAKKPLKSQLNQIRAWAREGRTDAWIAHQLDVSASELRGFRKRHGLGAEEEFSPDDDLRDTIEAEIEAAGFADEESEDEIEDEEPDDELDEDEAEDDDSAEPDADGDEKPGRRKRRRRRRGGGGRRPGVNMEASFDHGDDEGYGLWLDASIADDPVYDEHWKGHSAVEVTVEPDRIVIRRSGD